MPSLRLLQCAVAATVAVGTLHADAALADRQMRPGRGEHECTKGSAKRQASQAAAVMRAAALHSRSRRSASDDTAARKPMRIKVSDIDLHTPNMFCDGHSTIEVPDFEGSYVKCSWSGEDDLTAAKRAFLMDKLLPAAVNRLTGLLSVVPLNQPIYYSRPRCNEHALHPVAAEHGQSGVDFVLHVSAAPTYGSARAWAGTCEYDSVTMRPVAGYANFAPALIEPDGDFGEQLETAIHEMMHSMGFSNEFFGSSYGTPTKILQRRGTSVTVLAGDAVLREGKAHFGCDNFDGIELENEGKSSTSGSHFERRLMMEDIMAGVSGPKISRLTLAVFEDLGFYSANYSAADDSTTFGRDGGCGFLREKCNTEAGGAGKWFCFEKKKGCLNQRTAAGSCYIGDLFDIPKEFQYFPDAPSKGGKLKYMDYCPVMHAYGNRKCASTTYSPVPKDIDYGHYYGSDGRCFDVTDFAKIPMTRSGDFNACVQTRCRGAVLDVKLPVSDAAWIECTAGTQITNPEFNGYLTCPPPGEICAIGVPVPALTITPVTDAAVTSAPVTDAPNTFKVVKTTTGSGGQFEMVVRAELPFAEANAPMTGSADARKAYLIAITKQMRKTYSLPWPAYKTERKAWKNTKLRFWVVRVSFFGAKAP